MSYKNVTCVCEKNEIEKTRKEKNQSRKAARPAAHNLFRPAQYGSVMKEGLFCTLFLSFINGEAGLRLTILIRHVSEAG